MALTDVQKETVTAILLWLGGHGKLRAMVSASGMVALDDPPGFSFRFKGSHKANCCRILYNAGRDLYTFQLWKFHRDPFAEPTKVYELDQVYGSGLKTLFESETGLRLSL